MSHSEVWAPYEGVNWRTHIVVTSSDDRAFAILRKAAALSKVLAFMLEGTAEAEEIVVPLPKIDGQTALLMLEFAEHCTRVAPGPIDKPLRGPIEDVLSEWDKAFLDKLRNKDDNMRHAELIHVMHAANFLNIRPLLDLTCGAVASMINAKPVSYIRKLLRIKSDFSEEEQHKIDIENTWCEDQPAAGVQSDAPVPDSTWTDRGEVAIVDLFDEIIEFLPYNHRNARSIKSLSKAWRHVALMSQHWQGYIHCHNKCCLLLNPSKQLPAHLMQLSIPFTDGIPFPPLCVHLGLTEGPLVTAVARVHFASWPAEHVVAVRFGSLPKGENAVNVNDLILDVFGPHSLRCFAPCQQPLDLSKCGALRHLSLYNYREQVNGDMLRSIATSCPSLQSLSLFCCEMIIDRDLRWLEKLPSILDLDLSGCGNITDAGVKLLEKLPSITQLDLSCCGNITDAGMKSLEKLPSLTHLNLAVCDKITDAGMKSLEKLPSITQLDIAYCDITDAGMKSLEKLPSITQLNLQRCGQITEAGKAQLRAALPWINDI